MKTIILSIILTISSYSYAEMGYKTKLRCKGNVCEKVEEFEGLKSPLLTLKELSAGKCLIDIKTEKIIYLLDVNQQNEKIEYLFEEKDYVLRREIVFFGSTAFNKELKFIPCEHAGGVISNSDHLKTCLDNRGKYQNRIYCEKPRVRRF